MTMTLSLKDPFVQTCSEVLPTFGIDYRFMCELPESSLNSGEPVNLLIGLSNGVKGNIVVGMTKEAALRIVSGMMGGMEVSELNDMAKSALSEFANMLCGNAIAKIPTNDRVNVAPPTIITGDEIFLMISKAPAKKVFFKMESTKFNIAYSLE